MPEGAELRGMEGMLGMVVGVIALLVTMSLFFYFGIMSVLLWKLSVEGPETRRVLGGPLLPAFCQNFGIPLALLGFTLKSTEMVVIAGLLFAAAIVLTNDRSISLHPAIEAPMLGLALTALVSVGLLYSFA